jgi:4-aminobutyrate aminotransferase-like enzyme
MVQVWILISIGKVILRAILILILHYIIIIQREREVTNIKPGELTSTYGDNPMAMTVLRTIIQTMVEVKMPENAEKWERYLKKN